MKKIILLALATAALVTSCDNKEKEDQAARDAALQAATKQELQVAVADRDSLLSLVNDISTGMDQIKRLENILSVSNASGETASQREQIRADISAIQATLEQRRQQLDELQAKLKKSNLNNARLEETIKTLRAQIDNQAAEIETLRNNLNDANARIGQLNQSVDSLNTTVANVTTERDQAQQESTELTNELNTCYYVAASSKELKEHKIIESGFLRKTKLMKGNFDQKFFITADKRTLTNLNLHSKKAKVLTNQPAGSYEIVDNNGQKVLRILNPDAFWALSNYLVIQID